MDDRPESSSHHSHRRHHHGRSHHRSENDHHLLVNLVDAGLAATLFLVPMARGGAHSEGVAILATLALAIGVCWCLRQWKAKRSQWVHSAGEPLLAAAIVLGCLQVVPLPAGWLPHISPAVTKTLPLWSTSGESHGAMGIWNTISLEPGATRTGLLILTSLAVIFLVAVQRLRRIEDVERLLRWIAVSAVVMAVFGLVQYVSGANRFFWVLEQPYIDVHDGVKGGFVCRNHFADFMALGIGPLIWWIVRRHALPGLSHHATDSQGESSPEPENRLDPLKLALHILALAVCMIACLMSTSRGGFVVSCLAALVSLAVLARAKVLSGKIFLASAVGGAVMIATAALTSYYQSAKRLEDFQSLSALDPNGGRREIWRADAKAIADYPILGTGVGTHAVVNAVYQPSPDMEITHAENGYVQVAMEAGIPGLVLALAALGLYAFWCGRVLIGGGSLRVQAAIAAIAPGLAVTAVHSLWDFVWYIPGCMIVVVLLAACACRLGQVDRHEDRSAPAQSPPRAIWLAAACGLALLGVKCLPGAVLAVPAEHAWEQFLLERKTLQSAEGGDQAKVLRRLLDHLKTVLDWDPQHRRAHAEKATMHLVQFELAQRAAMPELGLTMISDAANQAKFSSESEFYDWLRRATGEHVEHLQSAWWHARESVALCPLIGRSYVILGKLAFLEGPSSLGRAGYIAQAVTVSPFEGDVLFDAGLEAMLQGKTEEALAHWKASFHTSSVHQQRLLEALGASLPLSVFVDDLQPDLDGMRQIAIYFNKRNDPRQMSLIRQRYAAMAEEAARSAKGVEAAARWREAGSVHRLRGDLAGSARCFGEAVACDPGCYDVRWELARSLYEGGDLAGAEKELQACRRYRPDDTQVQDLLEKTVEQRLGGPGNRHQAVRQAKAATKQGTW